MKGEEIQEKISKLSNLEDNTKRLSQQRQSFQAELVEVESALDNIDDSKPTYKLLGNFLVKKESADVEEELKQKQNVLSRRIKALKKKQEEAQEKIDDLQSEIMKEAE